MPISGTAQFINRTGQTIQTVPYSLAPRSSARIVSAGSSSAVQTGSVRLSSPAFAVSIFSLNANGVTVTQAGVPTLPAGMAFQSYVENGNTIRSGIAIANPSATAVDVTLEINGITTTFSIPGNGQTAQFVNEIPAFANLPSTFQGVLRMTSSAAVSVTGLRAHINERGEFLITTTAPVDNLATAGAAELFLPYFAEGQGYSMQFVLFGRTASGTMYFIDQAGNPASLLFR
jgi:hypothetical protein